MGANRAEHAVEVTVRALVTGEANQLDALDVAVERIEDALGRIQNPPQGTVLVGGVEVSRAALIG